MRSRHRGVEFDDDEIVFLVASHSRASRVALGTSCDGYHRSSSSIFAGGVIFGLGRSGPTRAPRQSLPDYELCKKTVLRGRLFWVAVKRKGTADGWEVAATAIGATAYQMGYDGPLGWRKLKT